MIYRLVTKDDPRQLKFSFPSFIVLRHITATDLGVKGVIDELRGTVSFADKVLTVSIDMIKGNIANPLSIIQNLTNLAKAQGAELLQIEAVLANERLYQILVSRYGMITVGGRDVILIPIVK